ncbi:hypothetical protein UCRNP2_8625 [Neofusicoccum parvum UCRNP2]|uniref:AAA+ ATPase lid domain-containing protein n=1 Tax=Botryosphaeria parva (strain UCR-NP2) TaxID=1287680 RepID=R1FZT1_BOTPV|nr:hypothetical protein UCRNP2_8625 [Neofusicoccum parvum UCRNP2]
MRIWRMNLDRVLEMGHVDVDDDAIMQFAKVHRSKTETNKGQRWNGRQIKNAFQTALVLADWDFENGTCNDNRHEGDYGECQALLRPRIRTEHFVNIAETSAHFDDYINDMVELDPSQREESGAFSVAAEGKGWRKDDFRTRDHGFMDSFRRNDSDHKLARSKGRRSRPNKHAASDSGDEEQEELDEEDG